jgi:hypothetical protein
MGEKRFNMAAKLQISAYGRQWSVNGDDGGFKAMRNFRLSAFPCGSYARKTKLIAIEDCDSCCRSGC